MSSFYKLTTRLTAAPIRTSALRPTSLVTRTPLLRRTIGTTQDPKTGPTSDSTQEGDVKSSRATDDPSSTEHGGSLAKPVSTGDGLGQSEEGGAPVKQDSDKSQEEKKKSIEKDGMKPLDAADK